MPKKKTTTKKTTTKKKTTNVKSLQKARKRKFGFSATQMTPSVSYINPPAKEASPTLYYTDEVWAQIEILVRECAQEVGWLGLVEELGTDYIVTELFVPEQTVSGVETEIKEDAMTKLAMDLLDAGKDTTKLFYWGHSHVNMAVAPSSQDEAQIDEYLEHSPLFFRGIYNKRGEAKVDFFDVENNKIHQCIDNGTIPFQLEPKAEKEFIKTIKANVKKQRVTYMGGNHMGKFQNRRATALGSTWDPLTGAFIDTQVVNTQPSLLDDPISDINDELDNINSALTDLEKQQLINMQDPFYYED